MRPRRIENAKEDWIQRPRNSQANTNCLCCGWSREKPAPDLWNELISGIGPTFAMRHDLAVEVSDILQLALKRGEQSTMSQAYQQDRDEPVRSSHESENPLGIAPAPSKELTVALTHETYREERSHTRGLLLPMETPL